MNKLQEALNLVALCEYQRQLNEHLEEERLEEQRLEEERLEEEQSNKQHKHQPTTPETTHETPETTLTLAGTLIALALLDYWLS